MKTILLFFLTVSAAFTMTLSGQMPGQIFLPQEKANIEVGQQKTLELPFAIQDYVSESSRLKVIKVENNRIILEGTVPGNASVILSSGNVKKVYSITISGTLTPVYNALMKELGDLGGVTGRLSEKSIILQGSISDVREWEYFNKVVRSYANSCSNYVRFQPGEKLFDHLKKELASVGIPVVKKISPERPGEVQFSFTEDVFTVTGFLFSQEDILSVEKILSAQKWLDPAWNKNSLLLKKDLRISDCQFDVNVVFVGISKNQLERLGNSQADGTVLSWNFAAWIRELVKGTPPGMGDVASGKGLYASLNTDLKGTLAFFGENGVSDFRDTGHLTLTNNSKTAAEFENGGNLQVKVATQDTADLKSIEFGLRMKISGGFVRKNELLLNLDLEKSLAPVKQDGDYFQRSTKTKTQLRCTLGKTVVIAGQKENTHTESGPAGYAFLRHVPVLNWFFAHEEEMDTEMYYLILIHPQLKTAFPAMQAIPAAETAHVEKKVYEKVKKREAERRAKEEKNWFLKMFTW